VENVSLDVALVIAH